MSVIRLPIINVKAFVKDNLLISDSEYNPSLERAPKSRPLVSDKARSAASAAGDRR